MNRRNFIKKSALSLPLTIGGFEVAAAYGKEWSWLNKISMDSDKVLVLIQLNGGNDGLSTFIPLDQYSNLFNARENIIIPEMDLLAVDGVDDLRFHPGLKEMQSLFNQEKMGIVQNVGYPNPNKSHFRSTDIWTSASDSSTIENTGWLGRYVEKIHPDFPDNYPNDENPDPLAITIDTLVSATCQGSQVNMSFAIANLDKLSQLTTQENPSEIPDNAYGNELKFIMQSIEQSNAYGQVINAAADKGNNLSELYPDTKLGDQLRVVAKLISGGLRTKIYVVKLGGFDTHDAQSDTNNPLIGKFASLMTELSQSVGAFIDDINKLGVAERVVALTFSEFGRRITSNDSYGTDHGEAAPLMIFGNLVNPIIHGENAMIPEKATSQDNLEWKIDFRSVYGSLLMDLFDMTETDARAIVATDFEYIKLIGKPKNEVVLRTQNLRYFSLEQNYPNPVRDLTTIDFSSRGMQLKMDLYDMNGKHVMNLIDEKMGKGIHSHVMDLGTLRSGRYFYQLREGSQTLTKKLIKK
ncbi:MAG: hypothetical protein ACJA08_000859 [Cyclobacteriaceae bacterium]|jgi:uncharacterized protein (DUF1501 family)